MSFLKKRFGTVRASSSRDGNGVQPLRAPGFKSKILESSVAVPLFLGNDMRKREWGAPWEF